MRQSLRFVLPTLVAWLVAVGVASTEPQGVQAPVLEWQHGGCFASWCETGWYSSPAVGDLDGDGSAEVVLGSWVEKGSFATGALHILDALGNPLHEVPLPPAFGSPDWNGALPAPTVANLDADPDLEVVLNTAHSGFVAYELPGSAGARLHWPTGRGSYRRSGRAISDAIFADGFESGNVGGWSASSP